MKTKIMTIQDPQTYQEEIASYYFQMFHEANFNPTTMKCNLGLEGMKEAFGMVQDGPTFEEIWFAQDGDGPAHDSRMLLQRALKIEATEAPTSVHAQAQFLFQRLSFTRGFFKRMPGYSQSPPHWIQINEAFLGLQGNLLSTLMFAQVDSEGEFHPIPGYEIMPHSSNQWICLLPEYVTENWEEIFRPILFGEGRNVL